MKELDVINPRTNEVIKKIKTTDPKTIKAIVADIHKAQVTWFNTPIKQRLRHFKNLQKIMLRKQDEIIDVITKDCGKNDYEAIISEFSTSFGALCYTIKNSKKLLKTKRIRPRVLKHIKVYQRYEAKGVVAVITPWNYPFYLSLTPIVSALVAGNGVIFKASEHTPLVGEMIHQLFMEAGFPKELFQIVYGAGDIGKEIVDADINHVSFTGSLATGQKINQSLAKRFITANMELGGKDAMVILDDVNLERAVNGSMWASFFNGGQICSSAERIYVHRNIYSEYLEKIKIRINEMNLNGDLAEVAPINNQAQFDLVTKQLAEAEKKCKEIISNRNFDDKKSPLHIAPTFVVEPDAKLDISQKETFGPVSCIFPFDSDEEVIDLVNASEYGLTASVWSGKKKRAKHIMDHIKAGQIYYNDHVSPQGVWEAPWGGFKNSGFGKSRGIEGLYAFTDIKIETFDRLNMKADLYWYGYSEFKLKVFKKFPKLIYWMYKF